MSETMDTLALKFVKEMRSAVSEQITLSIEKEIFSQIEKQNIISRKTSSASSQANATSSLSNDAHKNDNDKISPLQSNEHPIADKESAKDVHSVAEDINKREKKKKRKRKRQTDDDGETMNRFSCNQQ